MCWTSAEPKLAVSVTSVTDKVNHFFADQPRKSPISPVCKLPRIDNLADIRSLYCNDLRGEVTVEQPPVTYGWSARPAL